MALSRALIACVWALVFASGCEAWTRRRITYVGAPAPAVSPDAIEVFFLQRPERPYRVLGTFYTENRDIEELRRAAGARGCNALVLTTPNRSYPLVCQGYESMNIEATCLRYETR